jgi:hypothetical protein
VFSTGLSDSWLWSSAGSNAVWDGRQKRWFYNSHDTQDLEGLEQREDAALMGL